LLAGYTRQAIVVQALISNSVGANAALPMNEFPASNLKETCGVNVDSTVIEWQFS